MAYITKHVISTPLPTVTLLSSWLPLQTIVKAFQKPYGKSSPQLRYMSQVTYGNSTNYADSVADPREWPRGQTQFIRTQFADDTCSVRGMSEYYLQPTHAPNVVAERKSRNESQDTSKNIAPLFNRVENVVRCCDMLQIHRSSSVTPQEVSSYSV